MRLQVALSRAGCASRRKVVFFIKEGSVTVNGRIVTEPGYNVDPLKDKIIFKGKAVKAQRKVYFLLNKPKGVITTVTDTHNRKTVLDLVPKTGHRLYPVGRLDKDTSGLLLLTNDGDMAYHFTHPKFQIKRVYEAVVKGSLQEKKIKILEKGILLDSIRTAPCKIQVLRASIAKTRLKITIQEGRKRQIRNMFESIGYPVIKLKRIKFGELKLGGLKPGDYRKLTDREALYLQKTTFNDL